jgi:F-type H+-transporting ATPase subunit epsilon
MSLKLLVVTPEKKVVETEADTVELPGELGYLGILPGHTPLITLLATGVLSYRHGATEQSFALSSGFAEVAGDVVTVLAERAEAPQEIDAAAAQRDREKAEEEMKTAGIETLPAVRARLDLAEARLAVARGRSSQPVS